MTPFYCDKPGCSWCGNHKAKPHSKPQGKRKPEETSQEAAPPAPRQPVAAQAASAPAPTATPAPELASEAALTAGARSSEPATDNQENDKALSHQGTG